MNTVTITMDGNTITCSPDPIEVVNLEELNFDGSQLPSRFAVRFKDKKALQGKPAGQWHESDNNKQLKGKANVWFWPWDGSEKHRKYDVKVGTDILDPTIIIKRPPRYLKKLWLTLFAVIAAAGVILTIAFMLQK